MALPSRVRIGLKKILGGVLLVGLVGAAGALQSSLQMGCSVRHYPGPAISLAPPMMITLTVPRVPVGQCVAVWSFLPQILSLFGIMLVLWGFVDCTWGQRRSPL